MRFLTILNNVVQSIERIDFVDFLNGSFRARILSGTLTANRSLTWPDNSGTISTLTRGTAVSVTAVSSIDFAVSSGANRVTFMASGVYVPAGALLRLSAGGTIKTTGYTSSGAFTGISTGKIPNSIIGFLVPDVSTSITETSSTMVLTRINGNSWTFSGSSQYDADSMITTVGRVVLAGELDLIRFMPPSGSFAAGGVVNIFVET